MNEIATGQRDLAALLGSRICHDLISPLGAVSNGVELLGMSSQAGAPELALISESIDSANAKIRFFRIAFGAASAEQMIGRNEVVTLLRDLGKSLRPIVDWQVQADLPRLEIKLAFLLLQCFEAALPWGGDITVKRDTTGWHMAATSERLKIEAPLWALLEDPKSLSTVGSATVQFGLAPEIVRALGRRISVEQGDGTLTVYA